MNNTNELSEEEFTETLQRTRKIIGGRRKNKDSSDSETRHQSRVKWQLSEDQQKEADTNLLSFWQLIGGGGGEIQHIIKQYSRTGSGEGGEHTMPISTSPAQQVERKVCDVQVIKLLLTTTDETDEER